MQPHELLGERHGGNALVDRVAVVDLLPRLAIRKAPQPGDQASVVAVVGSLACRNAVQVAYQSMYPAGPPGFERSEPRDQTCLHFRQVTVGGSVSGVCVRTCGPGSPHSGHLPRYISNALTPSPSA